VLRLDEAVSLLGIEPLYGSDRHCRPLIASCPRPEASGGVKPQHRTERRSGASGALGRAGRTNEEVDPIQMGTGSRFTTLGPIRSPPVAQPRTPEANCAGRPRFRAIGDLAHCIREQTMYTPASSRVARPCPVWNNGGSGIMQTALRLLDKDMMDKQR